MQSTAHTERKTAILQIARHLFYTEGYESVTVRQIIETVGIAKGTFYHYFRSKEELLNALVDSMFDAIFPLIQDIVDNGELNALTKLQDLFTSGKTWKNENVDLVLLTMKQLYRDENILMRTKIQKKSTALLSSLYARVIRQGIEEGVFRCAYPNETATMIMALAIGMSETIVNSMLLLERGNAEPPRVLGELDRYLKAMDRAIERLIGLEPETLTVYGDVISHNFIEAFIKGGTA
jgi:AcrR family transcriptional regulator